MTDPLKGAVLGGSNLMVIATCAIIEHDSLVVPGYLGMLVLLAPIYAVVMGAMLGSVATELGPLPQRVRTFLLVGIALLALAVTAPFWPALMPTAIPFTIVHALILARWTTREPIAGAIARGRT